MPKKYDIIIIGAGHNGLTTAAYLSKAGKSVLVLERRTMIGGMCTVDDQPVGSLLLGGCLRPDIIRDLRLARFGYEASPRSGKQELIAPLEGSSRLVLSDDVARTAESIAALSRPDAARWLEFVRFMDKAASFLQAAYKTPMPRLPKIPLMDGLPLAQLGLKLRGMGAQDMYRVIRMLPMTAREFLDDWFESDPLKACIASLGIHNANLGVLSAGTAFNLLHQYFLRGGWAQPQTGDMLARLPGILSAAAQAYGAETRSGAEVARINVTDGIATGVTLANGDVIDSALVISALDPRRTLLSLVTPEHLDPEMVWKLQNIKMRGVTAKVYLELDGEAGLPGSMVVAPSLNYLERAYDAAKYGQISEKPYLEITSAGSLVSVHMQFAPYFLKGRVWDAATRASLEKLVVDILAEQVPGLNHRIQKVSSITPLDLENTYALTEGDLHHGQLLLEQFFFLRPLPGWSQHKTPITGLFLCGSGVHGGGGVSGIPGRNAARQVLKNG